MIFWTFAFLSAFVIALLNANAVLTISSIAIMVVSCVGLVYGWYTIKQRRNG